MSSSPMLRTIPIPLRILIVRLKARLIGLELPFNTVWSQLPVWPGTRLTCETIAGKVL